MKNLGILPLTMALIACGGSSSDGTKNGDTTPNSSPDSRQTIDCSQDKSSVFQFPIPEYPGSLAAYTHNEGGGFDPENFFAMAELGIMLGVSKSEEGMDHTGPTWRIVDESLTTTIEYTLNGSNETWTITKDGVDSGGDQYDEHVYLEVEQPATCGLSIRTYDDSGNLEGDFVLLAYEWTFTSYEEGQLTGQTVTEINLDRSGKTTSRNYEEPLPDYPVTIVEWDSTGEDVLIKTCKTTAGEDCQTAVAP